MRLDNYGPYGSEQAALKAVVERLVEGLHPVAVYLFGSRAEGRARPDSDFDLAVVLDDELPDAQTTYEGVYAPLLGLGIGCDVIPCKASEFREVLADPSNPWYDSWRNARKVYQMRKNQRRPRGSTMTQ